MSEKFGQGDIVRVLDGPHAGREGAIYDGIGTIRQREPWMKTDDGGRPQYRVYFDLDLDAGWFGDDQLELLKGMPEPAFQTGDRVRIAASSYWAQGEMGTVNAGGWDASLTPRVERRRVGPTRVHMVHLDHPHDDGSGDGPYIAGTFAESELELVEASSSTAPAYPAAQLAAEAEALRQVMENPGSGTPIERGPSGPTH